MSDPIQLSVAGMPNRNTINNASSTGYGRGPAHSDDDVRLWEVANQLEASFLSEMLKSAGLGKMRESFGGGIGEDQFSSFLRDAQAEEMVKRGGIGLAESLFEALKERSGGAG